MRHGASRTLKGTDVVEMRNNAFSLGLGQWAMRGTYGP